MFFHSACLGILILPSILSSQGCSSGMVWWLKVFRAALLPLWVSTVACSHALWPSAGETWSQYLQAYTHVLTHRGTGSIETTKSEDVCGPSGSTRVSLEKGKPVFLLFYFFTFPSGGRWDREQRHWETGGQARRHRLAVSAMSSALAGGSVHQKGKK